MSERSKERAWKVRVGETLPWVRIPFSPPKFMDEWSSDRVIFHHYLMDFTKCLLVVQIVNAQYVRQRFTAGQVKYYLEKSIVVLPVLEKINEFMRSNALLAMQKSTEEELIAQSRVPVRREQECDIEKTFRICISP